MYVANHILFKLLFYIKVFFDAMVVIAWQTNDFTAGSSVTVLVPRARIKGTPVVCLWTAIS
jgi:hypothetical protein